MTQRLLIRLRVAFFIVGSGLILVVAAARFSPVGAAQIAAGYCPTAGQTGQCILLELSCAARHDENFAQRRDTLAQHRPGVFPAQRSQR